MVKFSSIIFEQFLDWMFFDYFVKKQATFLKIKEVGLNIKSTFQAKGTKMFRDIGRVNLKFVVLGKRVLSFKHLKCTHIAE